METIEQLNQSIDELVERVKQIPLIKGEKFDSEELKQKVLPILNNAKDRLADFDKINENIEGVRNEIINPVVKTIKEKSKSNTVFSIISLLFGIAGIVLTVYTTFAGEYFNPTNDNPRQVNRNVIQENKVLIEYLENRKEDEISSQVEQRFKNINTSLFAGKIVIVNSSDPQNSKKALNLKNKLKVKGFKNVSVADKTTFDINERFSIPYIYFRDYNLIFRDIVSCMNRDEHYSNKKGYYDKYGKIIALIDYNKSSSKGVKSMFENDPKIGLVIVI